MWNFRKAFPNHENFLQACEKYGVLDTPFHRSEKNSGVLDKLFHRSEIKSMELEKKDMEF